MNIMKKFQTGFVLLLAFILLFGCNPNDGETPTTNPNGSTLNFGPSVSKDFIGQIIDVSNNPIPNALVKISGITKQTDANGIFIIKSATVNEQFALITVTKTGYIDGSRSLVPTTGTNSVKIMLLSNAPTQTINSGASSTVTLLSDGTKVTFDGSFKTDAGVAYSGTVSVILNHLSAADPSISSKMPGMLLAQNGSGDAKVLETYGMINVELRGSSGQKLQITNPAQIELPIATAQLATAPATIALWHYDETLGYWKEDGVANKVGTVYKGTVSHFSWWNCDYPFDKANLCINVVNPAGSPIANVRVEITPVGSVYGRDGFTNLTGQVCGIVPANSPLTIKLYDNCNNAILTTSVTGLAINSNTVLPNIVLTQAMIPQTTIQGNLLKCDGTNVTNGYLLLNQSTGTNSMPVTNGTFNFTTLVCGTTGTSFTLKGFDFDNLQTTSVLNFLYTFPITNVGNISACTSITEFISYQFDGGPVTTLIGNLNASGQGGIYGIFGSNPSVANQIAYIGCPITTPGTYTTANGFKYIKDSTPFYNIDNTVTNNVVFQLNSFGAIGQYIDMTVTGSFNDTSNISHTINATIHVIRDN